MQELLNKITIMNKDEIKLFRRNQSTPKIKYLNIITKLF